MANILGCQSDYCRQWRHRKAHYEIAQSQALLERAGADIIGVIINKVQSDKLDFINTIVAKRLRK